MISPVHSIAVGRSPRSAANTPIHNADEDTITAVIPDDTDSSP